MNINEFISQLDLKSHLKEIDLNDLFNKWFSQVDDYSKTLSDVKLKEKLLRAILKLIKTKSPNSPSLGLIYFKLATQLLFNGSSYSVVLYYLNLSYKDDEKWQDARRNSNKRHTFAKDMSAYRYAQILKAFIQYYESNPQIKAHVSPLLSDKIIRKQIDTTFASAFNQSLNNSSIGSLNWKSFDKLLGRNKYRVLVEQNYEGALYLCQRINDIHRKTDLAQYGLATAVITLCGATIEGVIGNMRYLIGNYQLKGKKSYTLGDYSWTYILYNKPRPRLIVPLLFLLSIRNQIHPTNSSNNKIVIDMKLAIFVVRLTESIIIEMAHSSKKYSYKKW